MFFCSPELSWRDVQHLVVRTSQFIPTLSGWRRNGAGLEYNPKVGFGLIDSNKMIEAAIQLKNNVGPQLVQKVPTGLVTYPILFFFLLTIKDQRRKVGFQQTHNQLLYQMFFKMSWVICA